MASPDQVKNQTGYTIGGVSPVGLINRIEIFMDSSLERFKKLYDSKFWFWRFYI